MQSELALCTHLVPGLLGQMEEKKGIASEKEARETVLRLSTEPPIYPRASGSLHHIQQ